MHGRQCQVSVLTRPWVEVGGSSCRWKGGVCAQILTLAQQSCCPRRGDSDQPSADQLDSRERERRAQLFSTSLPPLSRVGASTSGKNIYLCDHATPCNVCAEVQKVVPTDTFLGKAMQRKDDFTFDNIANVNTHKHLVTHVNHLPLLLFVLLNILAHSHVRGGM